MFINTVIIFLRDLLPIFILFTYVQNTFRVQFSTKQLATLSATSLFGMLLFVASSANISEWFDGMGLELSQSALLLLSAFSFVAAAQVKQWQFLILQVALCSFAILKLASFYVYFLTASQGHGSLQILLIAACVGIGISLSFAVLWSFFLNELSSRFGQFINLLAFASFVAGHSAQISDNLAQVDVLGAGETLFDISHIVADKSEYGHLLSALFGFEAAPTSGFALFYLIIFALCFSAFKNHKAHFTKEPAP
jgi:high-affinity iron transporter